MTRKGSDWQSNFSSWRPCGTPISGRRASSNLQRQRIRLDFAEVVPLEQQTPAFHGEYLIAAHNGRVIAERYVGVDVEAEI